MKKSKQLVVGQKFARLTVVKLDRIEKRVFNSSCSKSGKRSLNQEFYLCKCDCGKMVVVEKYHLTRNVDKTLSCGCVQGTHHKRDTRLYHIFNGMKKRCYNPNSKSYKDYGARNIKICDEWLNDFMNFYNWAITNGYNDNLTIERIDVNGNYEPSNCKWISKAEQSHNRRGLVLLDYKGETKFLCDIAKDLNLKYNTLYMGLKRHNPKYTKDFKIVGKIGQ